MTPDPAAPIPKLPYAYARRHGVLLRRGTTGALECAHRAALPPAAYLEAQRIAEASPVPVALSDPDFDAALSSAYRDSASQASEAAAGLDFDLAALADDAAQVDDLLDQNDDSPVIRLINALLLEAVKENASDIHIETSEKRVAVRFRIDGMLREMLEPKRALAPLLVSRIKVMARLDIAEKRLPQDGRVSLRVGGREVDVRVSTIPSQYGERVVMRLLDREGTKLHLPSLGMTDRDRAVFERLLRRTEGIILVTGPTGSGKTTTLYGAISHLNDRVRNIMTVEDPIEYALDGIAQTQVDAATDLTFAKGLRAILRQDPDVIMVGEIREAETAQIAIQSAMTGHLVLSTLHTNSAVGSVTRLLDLGAQRFLLAPMLTGLVAQRLVRVLCPACRVETRASEAEAAVMRGHVPAGAPVWQAAGCADCFRQGYRGRTSIYEIVAVDTAMQAMIHDGASEADLEAAARRAGPSLLADGAAKVLAGITSIEEVGRVVQED